MEHADRPHLAPHDVRHLFDGVRVPGGCQPDRRGKGDEAGRHHPVQRLVVEDRWDLQARLGDETPLDRVDALGDLVGQLVPEQADAGDMPDALSEQAVHLAGHRPVRSEHGQRNDRDSCIAFSSIVISRSSSSARCIGVAEASVVIDAMAGSFPPTLGLPQLTWAGSPHRGRAAPAQTGRDPNGAKHSSKDGPSYQLLGPPDRPRPRQPGLLVLSTQSWAITAREVKQPPPAISALRSVSTRSM